MSTSSHDVLQPAPVASRYSVAVAGSPERVFLERKLAQRFRTLDDDKNGFIEKTDFEVSVARLCDEFGHNADSSARQRLMDLSLSWWAHLVATADANRDGRISEAEYKDAWVKGLLDTPEAFDQTYMTYLSALMDVVDADGDGKITVSDEVRWTGALMHMPEAHARGAFRRLDKDGDGFINTQDLLDAIRAFYFDNAPDNKDSPGHWLLGPLV